jgi:hypothetical protein
LAARAIRSRLATEVPPNFITSVGMGRPKKHLYIQALA